MTGTIKPEAKKSLVTTTWFVSSQPPAQARAKPKRKMPTPPGVPPAPKALFERLFCGSIIFVIVAAKGRVVRSLATIREKRAWESSSQLFQSVTHSAAQRRGGSRLVRAVGHDGSRSATAGRGHDACRLCYSKVRGWGNAGFCWGFRKLCAFDASWHGPCDKGRTYGKLNRQFCWA